MSLNDASYWSLISLPSSSLVVFFINELQCKHSVSCPLLVHDGLISRDLETRTEAFSVQPWMLFYYKNIFSLH